VHALAAELGVAGFVGNDVDGVLAGVPGVIAPGTALRRPVC
jgi:hypothetical protein